MTIECSALNRTVIPVPLRLRDCGGLKENDPHREWHYVALGMASLEEVTL